MTRGGVIVSIGVHVVLVAVAMAFKSPPPDKRHVAVAVVGAEKKKAEPKPPPPPPPPPPKVAKVAAKVSAPPPPAPAPTPEPVHEEAAPPPIASGLEMSNTGPGVDVGTDVKNPNGNQAHDTQPKPQPVRKPKAVENHDQPPPPTADGPAPCTEEPTKPEPVTKTEIEYTDEARANGVEGRLVLKVTVDANGAVTDVNVASGVDPSLDAAAVASVKQWRFKPSQKCGKSVAGSYTIARRFELGD